MYGNEWPMMAPSIHAPQPQLSLEGNVQRWTRRGDVLGMLPWKHSHAVQRDKCPGRLESRAHNPISGALLEAMMGDPGVEGDRVVPAGEGLLGFRNRNFDVAQRAAFKLIGTILSSEKYRSCHKPHVYTNCICR